MKKVVVGMSGGVDSAVAAYLLKQDGFDVAGLTVKTWHHDDKALSDARAVAERLDIPYYVENLEREFYSNVVDYFIDEYVIGRTPNPCVVCNRYVKWQGLLRAAERLGADAVATGHYAKVVKYPKTGRYTLAAADSKDQTYALFNLTQYQLSRTAMPLYGYKKEQIRQLAQNIGLDVANKPDSQDICFVPDNDYKNFIRLQRGDLSANGNFVDKNGKILGSHNGITDFTIGQRKGLGIALGKPAYVCGINSKTNDVILGDNADLFSSRVRVDRFNPMAVDGIKGEMRVSGKVRYSQNKCDCTLNADENGVFAVFDKPQRAVTPGQAAVFYDGDYVIGGGIISGSE